MQFDIKPITAKDTLPVRHTVLWPDKPIEFSQLADDSKCLHFGIFVDQHLVTVASVFLQNDKARLRKFATLHDYQGNGLGRAMLEHIETQLAHTNCKLLWCDDRTTATTLYERFGMQRTGELFYKQHIPYYRMSKNIRK